MSEIQVHTKSKKCFQFSVEKCVGCHACVVACSIENQNIQEIPWREINTFNPLGFPEIPVFHYSLACNHCDDAPCMKNCPAVAYSKDKSTGAIVHTADKCIGCKYCTWACPYDAPKFNKNLGVIEKCTFCNSRIETGLKPACANLCPTGALDFIDIHEDLTYKKTTGFDDYGIKPSIKIIESKTNKNTLVTSENQRNIEIKKIKKSSKIGAVKEWPLIVFTFITTILVSVFTAATIGAVEINEILFICSGIAASILSFLHLGRKLRAWRSILNLKNSWLSREIFFFGCFFGTSVYYLFFSQNSIIAFLAIIFGIITLISIDKVYEIAVLSIPSKIHSAQVLLSFFLFSALFSEAYKAFIFIVIIKSALYFYRKHKMFEKKINFRLFLSGLRLDLLISFPLIFWWIGLDNLFWWIVPSILLGEIIDRIEYYDELDIIDPKKQMEMDLKKSDAGSSKFEV